MFHSVSKNLVTSKNVTERYKYKIHIVLLTIVTSISKHIISNAENVVVVLRSRLSPTLMLVFVKTEKSGLIGQSKSTKSKSPYKHIFNGNMVQNKGIQIRFLISLSSYGFESSNLRVKKKNRRKNGEALS